MFNRYDYREGGEGRGGIIRGECESFLKPIHRLARFAPVIESLVCKETITMSRLINGLTASSIPNGLAKSKIRPRNWETVSNRRRQAALRSFAPSSLLCQFLFEAGIFVQEVSFHF